MLQRYFALTRVVTSTFRRVHTVGFCDMVNKDIFPEGILTQLFANNNIVVVGEDHTDHSAKRLIKHTLPHLAEKNVSFAWEMVRADNPKEKEDLRPDQTAINAFLSGEMERSAIEAVIRKYCHDYGSNMVDEKMSLLDTAKQYKIPIVGIDTSEFSPWRRIGDANPFWVERVKEHQEKTGNKVLLLGGKFHIHSVNLFDEHAGDQATGVDKLLDAISVVVHTSKTGKLAVWNGSDGHANATIEMRVPEDYWEMRHDATKWVSRCQEGRILSKETLPSL